ncbi:hypothetical protein HW132_05800 [Brasilonema sp. CT11]|nr:hypothetical protein [Brasilonema sp. CT11]
MVLFTQNLEKHIGGFCLLSIPICKTCVLADFAREYSLGKNKRILLAIDQAGWHTSNDVKLPEGIDLIDLPAYSPELQLFSSIMAPNQ